MRAISELDDRDRAIVAERMVRYWARAATPQTGDWIRFADGIDARVAYVWRDGEGWTGNAQVADPPNGGSFHLGEHGITYSGSLDPGVPVCEMRPAFTAAPGVVWIFHHGWARAHNGVAVRLPNFQVWLHDSEYASHWWANKRALKR